VNVYDTLAQLQIELPGARTPGAVYVPHVQTGRLVFLSGHTARKDGQPWVGKLGAGLTTAEGQAAACAVAIDLLGTLHAAVGDLNRVRRIVKLTCLVNSSSGFTELQLVADGASQLLALVLGKGGAHTRSAFGVAQIPHGACLEIEMIAELNRPGAVHH
jgi:enamine deaminase RidA (YjgF/YER057c/UK114 family)